MKYKYFFTFVNKKVLVYTYIDYYTYLIACVLPGVYWPQKKGISLWSSHAAMKSCSALVVRFDIMTFWRKALAICSGSHTKGTVSSSSPHADA